ncbi:replication-associated protein [robinz virus RP_954]|nr:replication-associated protein [robinz virus RP_954]
MSQRRQLKRIVFTLNNYDQSDEERIQGQLELNTYAIYGREVAPTTGTRHLQGFINFKTKREFGVIKKLVGNTGHIEPAKGTDQQNQEYCRKGNDYWEHGEPSRQGMRSDLKEVVETVKGAKRLADIVDKHPESYIKYHRGIEKLFGIIGSKTKRDWKTSVFVFFGETGTGKSRAAAEKAGKDVYYKPRGEWWDGYNGEKAVIIDDFYGWLKHDEMLRLMDRYPHQVPIKGGFSEFLSRELYITSNKPWFEWYKPDWFTGQRREAFRRRLDKIYECTFECFIEIKD